MRFIFYFITVVFLVACAYSSARDDYETENPPQNPSKEVEVRELTDEIRKALDVPQAAAVIVYDFNERPILFRTEEFTKGPAEYPVKASSIDDTLFISFIRFTGSHCVDYINNFGDSARWCAPPRYHNQ